MTVRLSLAKSNHLGGVSAAVVEVTSSSDTALSLELASVPPSSTKSDFSGVNAMQLARVQPKPRCKCGFTIPSLEIEKHSPVCSVPEICASAIWR